MAYRLKHETLRIKKGYVPTSYENVPIRDEIAICQRKISILQLNAMGWTLIDEVKDTKPKATKPDAKPEKKKKKAKKS